MNGHAHAMDTLIHAQTAGSAYARLGWTRRVLLRLIGGRFVKYAVHAGYSAHAAAETEQTPLRAVSGIRLSTMIGGRG